jgi:hypothetical protein
MRFMPRLSRYVATYEYSPVYRDFIAREEKWYARELIKIYEEIDPPSEKKTPAYSAGLFSSASSEGDPSRDPCAH